MASAVKNPPTRFTKRKGKGARPKQKPSKPYPNDKLYQKPKPDYTQVFLEEYNTLSRSLYTDNEEKNKVYWIIVDRLVRMIGQIDFPMLVQVINSDNTQARIHSGNQFLITLWVAAFSEIEKRVNQDNLAVSDGNSQLAAYIKGNSVLNWFLHCYMPISHKISINDCWANYFFYKGFPLPTIKSNILGPAYATQTINVNSEDEDLEYLPSPLPKPSNVRAVPLLAKLVQRMYPGMELFKTEYDYAFEVKYERNSQTGNQVAYGSPKLDTRDELEKHVTQCFVTQRNIILKTFGFLSENNSYLGNLEDVEQFADDKMRDRILRLHYNLLEAYNYQKQYTWLKKVKENNKLAKKLNECSTQKLAHQETLQRLQNQLKAATTAVQATVEKIETKADTISEVVNDMQDRDVNMTSMADEELIEAKVELTQAKKELSRENEGVKRKLSEISNTVQQVIDVDVQNAEHTRSAMPMAPIAPPPPPPPPSMPSISKETTRVFKDITQQSKASEVEQRKVYEEAAKNIKLESTVSLLDQIKQGKKLKAVDKTAALPAMPNNLMAQILDRVDMTAVFDKRRKDIAGDDRDDEEWDDESDDEDTQKTKKQKTEPSFGARIGSKAATRTSPQCTTCGITSRRLNETGINLKVCSGPCKDHGHTYYCSPICAHVDWGNHRLKCTDRIN